MIPVTDAQISDRLILLKKVEIFSKTSEDILREIASVLTEVKCRQNQSVFRKGDEGKAMFIITSGSFRVHDGGHVIYRLKEGYVFGEFALFDNELRSASVTAEEPSALLK